MRGLEVDQGGSGTLFTINVNDRTLYEFDRNGIVVGSTYLQGVSDWITDFTFGADMSIWVANQASEPLDVDEAVPSDAVRFLSAMPNPFSARVEFRALGALIDESATLSIYDLSGRLVRSIEMAVGTGLALWDGVGTAGSPMPAGTYFVKIVSGAGTETTRLTLIR